MNFFNSEQTKPTNCLSSTSVIPSQELIHTVAQSNSMMFDVVLFDGETVTLPYGYCSFRTMVFIFDYTQRYDIRIPEYAVKCHKHCIGDIMGNTGFIPLCYVSRGGRGTFSELTQKFCWRYAMSVMSVYSETFRGQAASAWPFILLTSYSISHQLVLHYHSRQLVRRKRRRRKQSSLSVWLQRGSWADAFIFLTPDGYEPIIRW